MKTLKKQFKMNGLPYSLIKRNDKVALYGIGGTFTNEILHWEVSKIYIRKDMFGIRESIPTNEKFGKDLSRCYSNKEKAFQYFDTLTNLFNQGKGVPEVVTGITEDVEVAS